MNPGGSLGLLGLLGVARGLLEIDGGCLGLPEESRLMLLFLMFECLKSRSTRL